MVPKDALMQLFQEKVENPLKQLKDNKVNIENYLSNVRVWFTEYKKDEIEQAGFKRFLKHLESKTIDALSDVKGIVKPKIIDAVNTFLEEVESHTSEEVTNDIESVIKDIGGDIESISKKKNMMKMPRNWKTQVFAIIIILVLGVGIYYTIFYEPLQTSQGQNQIEEQTSVKELDQDQNPAEEKIDETNNSIKENIAQPDNPLTNDAFKISDNRDTLTSIEQEVFNLINNQRESYYLNKYEIDINYTRLLKEDAEDIPKKIGLETFVFELDQELALKGDDIPLAIFSQMNKHNLFQEDLTKLAISIEQVKYKFYRVQLAFY